MNNEYKLLLQRMAQRDNAHKWNLKVSTTTIARMVRNNIKHAVQGYQGGFDMDFTTIY